MNDSNRVLVHKDGIEFFEIEKLKSNNNLKIKSKKKKNL